jgi:hypothetical protein
LHYPHRSTHPKLQQQAEHQPKHHPSQKQMKALIAMTMTTGYPGKKSAKEVTKDQAPEPTTKKSKPQEINNHPSQITITNKFETL